MTDFKGLDNGIEGEMKILKNLSTKCIIAELEKRRPDCSKCTQTVRYLNENGRCENCIGKGLKLRDNFKKK